VKNTLGDLNNYLFAQMERLDDESLSDEDLKKELERSKAITGIASQIVANANLVLKAKIAYDENIDTEKDKPKMLEG